MKLVCLFTLIVTLLSVSSCTKDRTCSCSNGNVYTVMNATKMEAGKTCDDFMFDLQKSTGNKKLKCDVD